MQDDDDNDDDGVDKMRVDCQERGAIQNGDIGVT